MRPSLTDPVSTAALAVSDAPSCVGTLHLSLVDTLSLGEKNNTTNELHKSSYFTHHCQKHADFELKTL